MTRRQEKRDSNIFTMVNYSLKITINKLQKFK